MLRRTHYSSRSPFRRTIKTGHFNISSTGSTSGVRVDDGTNYVNEVARHKGIWALLALGASTQAKVLSGYHGFVRTRDEVTSVSADLVQDFDDPRLLAVKPYVFTAPALYAQCYLKAVNLTQEDKLFYFNRCIYSDGGSDFAVRAVVAIKFVSEGE